MHRDIKPENFVIGLNNPSLIYIIDYGLSKYYCNPQTESHIPFLNNRSFIGTVRYVSLNTHLGYEQSRRDDMEGLGYSFI